MDDISIWDVALSEADLMALFDGAETPLTLQPEEPNPTPERPRIHVDRFVGDRVFAESRLLDHGKGPALVEDPYRFLDLLDSGGLGQIRPQELGECSVGMEAYRNVQAEVGQQADLLGSLDARLPCLRPQSFDGGGPQHDDVGHIDSGWKVLPWLWSHGFCRASL